ncbi:MAG TPA: DNA polymerase Y family protein [Usitatibacter sp.]|nr:DNA polymerase Y family protein [Usitatibacter sp.]
MLWVALELPALPLQIAERAGALHAPLVISEGASERPTVACANQAAKAAGIREGQAVASAKALAAELRVLARNANAEREALERLAAWAGQFTPMVSLDGQSLVLEVEASLRLFSGHARLTAAIRRGVRDLGFQATLGIAPTPLAARLFARAEARGLRVRACLALPELRERLEDLPLFLLDWPEKTLARLTDLGVLRLRDVLTLPAEGIARRFGPEIVSDLDRLLGVRADPRLPYAPPARFRSRLELPAEAEGLEALLFPLRRLLLEFEGYARGRGAGVQRLLLSLSHARKARTHLELEFAAAEREADFILAIAREKLGRLSLPAATYALELSAEALLAYGPRSGTWLPGAREQALDCDRLLERLTARLGRDRVFGIALSNDHRPERHWQKSGEHLGLAARNTPGQRPSLAIAKAEGARPAWLLHRPQRLISPNGEPSLQGALNLFLGPERIEAGWWDGEAVSRDYYVAANARGETFWIYREHRDPSAWYLHGVFA